MEEYVFVPLDILKEIVQNNGIRNHLEAWLTFLCMDEPEWILKLSENYPMFRKMYEEIYEMCRNLESSGDMSSINQKFLKLFSYHLPEKSVTLTSPAESAF